MKRYSKLFISVFLIAVLAFGSVISVNAKALPLYGDVFTDGNVTIADATQISKYLAELTTLSDEQLVMADYNGDEVIDVKDATDIQKMLADLNYKYTHELYEVEYLKFSAEDLTAIPFTVDKRVNGEEYNSETKDYYYFKANPTVQDSSLTTLFKTHDEYNRFFNATFDKYNEEFFEESSLIYLYAYEQYISDYFTLDNVYIEDNVLYLEITNWSDDSDFLPDMFANWNQFVVVNKADVENIDKICVKSTTSYY